MSGSFFLQQFNISITYVVSEKKFEISDKKV